jgi:peptide/nickel transport system substrate-binding protein
MEDAGKVERMMGMPIEPALHEGGVFVEGGDGDLESVSPIFSIPYYYMPIIFETLIDLHPIDYQPVGNLAAAWEALDDGSAWLITLRDGVTWHDGEAFNADDVKTTFDLHMNEETGSSSTFYLNEMIEGVEIVDDRTIRFDLKDVIVDFLIEPLTRILIGAEHILTMVPPAELQQHASSTGEDPAMVVGTGAFKFAEWVPGDHTRLVRYDEYWDGRPHLDEFVYVALQSQANGAVLLKTGEIDFTFELSPLQAPEFDGTDVQIIEYPSLGSRFLALNLDEAQTTLFQDVRVRQALRYAIDTVTITETVMDGYATPADQIYPPYSPYYDAEGVTVKYGYEPETARQLLDEAGWLEGADGVREKDGQPFSFTAWTRIGDEERANVLTAIQEYFREVGVQMDVQLEQNDALEERTDQRHDFEAVLDSDFQSSVPDQTYLWACDAYPNGANYFKYCNPEVDELLAQGLVELDPVKRKEIYTQFQNLVLADLPVIPLYFLHWTMGLNNRVHNYFPGYVGVYVDRFNAETWWVEPVG